MLTPSGRLTGFDDDGYFGFRNVPCGTYTISIKFLGVTAFLCGLICTSLPITGFLIWWNSERKKKKRDAHMPIGKWGSASSS